MFFYLCFIQERPIFGASAVFRDTGRFTTY